MGRSRQKAKGRRESGYFAAVPTVVLKHKNFKLLSPTGHKLFNGLLAQLRVGKNGSNNGDLCATHSMLKEYFTSKDTLQNAVDELIYYGFISLTRQGARLRKDLPNLYAFTFLAIDECGGKLDVPSTNTPTQEWKEEKPKYQKPCSRKRRKRDSENSQPRQTGQGYPGKRGGESKSGSNSSICTPANGAQTAILDDSLPRQTGNFLESAIGISLSSLSQSEKGAVNTPLVETGNNALMAELKAIGRIAEPSATELTRQELSELVKQKWAELGVSDSEYSET